jgi:NAD(P)-dependent dehydrogenase (short-subunit alcohol dehydrogenase family)
MTRSIRGQVVVVTGAARGIGALLARTLAARGARPVLVGLEPEELARVADELDTRYWVADVTDQAALATVATEITEAYERVDVLVANAGIATGGPFLDAEARTFDRVIEVNLLGSIATARAFLPALLASRGYYLQIASLAALSPAPMMAAYCASKAGVEAFAHSLRAEVGYQGVKVGVGYLSWTDTDMVRGADQDEVLRDLRSRLPWPTNRTYPLAPAVERIADGIERRSAHVYAQWWLRGMQPLRSYLPSLVGTVGRREMRRAEPALRATAHHRRGLVGPGGRAAETHRR